MSIQVNVSELQSIANQLFEHMIRSKQDIVALDKDFYWFIPKEGAYDPYVQPSVMTLGQLSADLRKLIEIGDGDLQPLSYGMVWLAAILRAIGEETVT